MLNEPLVLLAAHELLDLRSCCFKLNFELLSGGSELAVSLLKLTVAPLALLEGIGELLSLGLKS